MGRTYESMMEELEVIEILSTAYDGDEFPGYENIRLSFGKHLTVWKLQLKKSKIFLSVI